MRGKQFRSLLYYSQTILIFAQTFRIFASSMRYEFHHLLLLYKSYHTSTNFSLLIGFAIALTIFIYFAFVWKMNLIRDCRKSNTSDAMSMGRAVGELPPVYPNGWFALLESSQLKRGQVKHVSALGENFAVFRTKRGTVRILDAYCPHLGANMAIGGKVKGDCLECPFHSWVFDGKTGACEHIPYSKKIPAAATTRPWKSCEINSLIFVWYHAENYEPTWFIEPNEKITNGSFVYQGRNEFYINCHAQEIPENGADLYHLSAVHGPAPFFGDNPEVAYHGWTNASWKPYYDEGNLDETTPNDSTKKHRAKTFLQQDFVVFDTISLLRLDVCAEQFGPGYVELTIDSALGQMFILQTTTPLGPLLQRVTHTMFSSRLLAPFAKAILFGETVMFQRDVDVWNHKRFERRPVLVKEEKPIRKYRQWYSQFYSENSPKYICKSDLEW